MSNAILSIQDLQVNYGGIEAVKGISFDVPEGEIVTLIGANGAGKSSTLRTIAGLVKPKSGTITYMGEDITGKDPTAIVTKGITLVPEGRRIFPDLTVKENLKLGAYTRKEFNKTYDWSNVRGNCGSEDPHAEPERHRQQYCQYQYRRL